MRWGSLLASLSSAALGATIAAPGHAGSPDAAHGETLARLGGCASCHTADDGAPYAGGHEIKTEFGSFYGSNLTPDRDHGLGAWTYDDFERAMRHGIGPDGTRYWPAFPYTSFQRLTDDDLADLWAYLQTLPASDRPEIPHERQARWQLRIWRPLAFRQRGVFEPDADRSEVANRGAYLTEAVAHCGECHTPRGGLGGLKHRAFLAGSDAEPEGGPNLTPHEDALGAWTHSDWTLFLESGMTPEGDFVGGQMGRVVREGTAKLSEADRAAMATFLMGIPPKR